MGGPTHSLAASAEAAAELLLRVRETAPLVQCLTNSVVANFTANVLLALGAAPAMVDVPGEAEPFARVASGVLVNLGTPAPSQQTAMREAVSGAVAASTPWVLDPVAVGALPVRTDLARELVGRHPAVVRGNASEILALAGLGAGGRGVDASDSPEAAVEAAMAIAALTDGAVAISGDVDLIVAGGRTVRVANGTPLLTRVTGGGCALGAVMAAFASIDGDPGASAAAATAYYTVAAELAAGDGSGPGSFQASFLDSLAAVTPELVAERAVVR